MPLMVNVSTPGKIKAVMGTMLPKELMLVDPLIILLSLMVNLFYLLMEVIS